MKHTPTPWICEGTEIVIEKAEEDGCLMICKMYPGNIRDKEDAEFIVRAVNSHEELLEAAKVVLEKLNAVSYMAKMNPDWLDNFKKAIDKAEGK